MDIAKFVNHLYFLSKECITVALFDDLITEDTKLKIVKKSLAATEVDSESIDGHEIDEVQGKRKLALLRN